MGEIVFTDSDIQELRAIFLSEAGEILENLPQFIMAVEESPDEEKWKELKRAFHTLKGDSKAMGFNSLGTFAHKVEDLIEDLKMKGTDKPSIDLLFECSDAIKVFIDKVAKGEEPDISYIVSKIESHTAKHASLDNKPVTKDNPSHAKGETERFNNRNLPFLKIEPERVDRIMNLVGELVIGRSMLSRITSDINRLRKDSLISGLESLNSSFERILSDLQSSVMKVRMLPVDHIFRRFPRAVRDLSTERGKKVRLLISGENTELDKGIVDVIGEPLLHIIRNSIDHGIETPEQRKMAGKQEEGLLFLRAFHQGNQMVIEVEDDGRGIDIDEIREKAVQKGFISIEESKRFTDREAINLIFLSGFSTSEVVTEISGRGVGMNIVKEAIESLRGIIDVHTEKGKGTKIILRLPLTLTIMKSILFACSEETFAIPLTAVTEIIRIAPEELERIGGKPVLRHRNGIVPIIYVDGKDADGGKVFIIVIGVAQLRAGLAADRIIGEEELVIKSLDDKTSTGIASGASILGDGRVVLILDPLNLIKRRSDH